MTAIIKIGGILTILGLLVFACKIQDTVTNEVTEYYRKNGVVFHPNLKLCIILPEVGCGGCIASGVDFFQRNKEKFQSTQEQNMIIFTSITSMKLLYRNLGIDSLNGYYSYLDKDNKYLVKGDNSIYPLILHLRLGQIVKAEYQSPYSGDILGKLEKDELQ